MRLVAALDDQQPRGLLAGRDVYTSSPGRYDEAARVQRQRVAAREHRRVALQRVEEGLEARLDGARACPPPAASETRYSPIREGAMRGVTQLDHGRVAERRQAAGVVVGRGDERVRQPPDAT